MAASSPLCHLGSSACLHRLESGMWATTNPFQDSRECINHRIQFSFRRSKTTGLKRGRRICLIIRSLPDRQTEADNLRIIACKAEVASDNQIKEEILEEWKPGPFQPSRRLILGTALVGLIRPLLPIPEAADAVEDDTATSLKKENEPAKSIIGNIVKEKPSRVYDATVLGEPVPMGVDRARLWQKLLAARVVYLGESERVPDPDDKIIELEIVRTLRDKCFEQQRPITLALQAFPSTLQPQLNKYMSKRLSDDELKDFVNYWPKGRWEEHLPLLNYCRDNGVRLMGCGMPLEILRTVQAKGLKGLSQIDRQKYVPPRGGMPFPVVEESTMDLLPKASGAFGPGPYQFAQARVIEDFNMAQVATQAMSDGGSVGLLVVIAGASHVQFGARGSGLPARISKKLQKKTQMVILLNPERQHIRQEGEVPEADLLWYSAAKTCDRNCFDRAEVARVMAAAGRRRDALPQDLQAGLERGIVSPELLQSFFDLEQQPFIAELTKRFQGLRERWFADPRFLQRLAIEETISITTTLLAQYERRKDRFWKELDYVITDTVRGSVVDFFTVWLPAPRLAFRPLDTDAAFPTIFNGLNQLLGSFPDNAFQRAHAGQIWDLKARIIAVAVSGFKLFGVGFISSLGTLTVTNTVLAVRRMFDRQSIQTVGNKRSPVFKTAVVYASFLGTSANLRYQTIAGLVEHWIADYVLASQPMAGNIVSFVARVVNSYWGTQQWIDLARLTGLQAHRDEQSAEISPSTHLEPVSTEINVLPTSANSIIETESDEQYIGKKPEAPFVRRD